jgi:hypothetical protein
VSASHLKTRVKRLAREFAASNFTLKLGRILERDSPGLRQGLEFQPGTRRLADRFTVNVFWTFTIADPDASGFAGARRIGDFVAGTDMWFSSEPAQIDSDFAKVRDLLERYALPYLDEFSSVKAIVSGYERGHISCRDAFGADRGWQRFNLGFCYSFLGRSAPAITNLRAVVEEYSAEPWEWVQSRKARAEAEIARLSAA